MNRMIAARLFGSMLTLAILSGAACDSDRHSSTIETNEMTARFIARADGTGATELFAELLIPGDLIPENVNVSGGDRLIAKRIDPNTLEEREKLMIEHSDFDTNYGAGFRIDDKQTGFEIAFDRSASGRVSANDSSVTLPSPFALDWVSDPVAMTPAPQSFSRSSATPYFVVWDPFAPRNSSPAMRSTIRSPASAS